MSAVDFSRRYIAPVMVLNGRGCVALVNDVSIHLTKIDQWTDKDVIQWLEDTSRICGHISPPANIAVFLGAVLNASQRKLATQWVDKNNLEQAKRITMISDSILIRGALTGYSWITGSKIKAFSMQDSDAMCEWIARGQIAEPHIIKTTLKESFSKLNQMLP